MTNSNFSIPSHLLGNFDELRLGAQEVRMEQCSTWRSYQDRTLSRARFLEMLLAHYREKPPTAGFIAMLDLRSNAPGRPRRDKLGSSSHPPVREDQPSGSQDEEKKTTHLTDLPYDGGCGGINGT
jgi:hypothetical protein